MKIVFFTFYYPPDLSAGSFRAVALAETLSIKIEENDEIHVITTHPNRYVNYRVVANDLEEVGDKLTVHRVAVPTHKSGMVSQARSFMVYAVESYRLCRGISPDFLIGTTGRLMTGVLTGFCAFRLQKNYFIDLRDIFSEAISDLFARKNMLLGHVAKKIFSLLDGYLLAKASGVNVVSEGFYDYFKEYDIDINKWSFFPNGVDQEFVGINHKIDDNYAKVKTILYAGNIGSGQGLETIVPQLAQQLGDGYRIMIVGNGGMESILKKEVEKYDIGNVDLIEPVSRTDLMRYYSESDILFLHLNDIPAFRRVLPSKIFEYAALGKPIVAGVRGYSEQFIKENISYASVFEPGDYKNAALLVGESGNVEILDKSVDDFVNKYSRRVIMEDFSEHILSVMRRAAQDDDSIGEK